MADGGLADSGLADGQYYNVCGFFSRKNNDNNIL